MTATATNPAAGLAAELEAARQLKNLLGQEQAQLIRAEIDNLGNLVQQKATLIARMAELADARLRALAAVGYHEDEASMDQWLASAPNSTAANREWTELLSVIQSAKEINRTNGLLIGSHMSRNQAALQILQGNNGGQVYSRDGQTSTQASRRSLVVG